jgi:poly(3-hydroxybutyrate) depolymerase
MAVVEQKCATDIPQHINGKRHYEDFESQVEQFKTILEFLKNKSGYPSHLVAVCQPGPLLITTLILYPHLAKTFGSAGSPMHTEGERGMLTDFSRMMGEDYIDHLINLFSGTIPEGEIGAGRKIYDGRLQVLGFYYLGMDQHLKNFRKYYTDLKQGNKEAAQRQKDFYHWYNWTHHFPAGFIRDTYKKIFVNNDLIHGRMKIGKKTVSIKDYPGNVPIWSLGGSKDDIVPPKQANGHLDKIDSVPEKNKLALISEAGHMGLFRSSKVLKNDYSKVVRFLLKHSDRVEKPKKKTTASKKK